MYNPRYLSLSRHNIYYLRYPIPPELHPKGRNSEVRCSLGTRDPKEALHLARRLVYCGDTLLSNPAMAYMNYKEISTVLFKHFKEQREQVKERLDQQGPMSASTIGLLATERDFAAQEVKTNDFSLIGTDENITAFIEEHSLPITEGTEAFETLRIEYTKAKRDALHGLITLNQRYDGYDFTTNPYIPQIINSEPKQRKRILLSSAIDAYLKERHRSNLRHKSLGEMRSHLDLLQEYLGKKAHIHASPEQANAFKELLYNLPKYARSKPALKKLSLQELVDLPDSHELKANGLLDPASIRKYITTYSGFYDWAMKRKDTDENNFKDINLRIKKGKQTRDPFSREETKAIYEALLQTSVEHHKWGTLIAFFTGARREEIAQMNIEDIKQEDGIWFFDINHRGDKRLKTLASEREIPIHSQLIELGFLEYVEKVKAEDNARLFPELSKNDNNGYGRSIGRWFNETLLPRLGIKRKGLVFHCLRNTLATNLQRKGVEDSLVKRIIGHSQKDVMNRHYAQGQTLKQRQEAIELLWPL
ncbi:MAG: tyrosine-type recombinase/integrase [Bdellovibrionales bacterium]